MGFSVAATWALEVAADEARGDWAMSSGQAPRAVVGVGGYADFSRLARAMLIGEHEWRGRAKRYSPDPYGRWILGANLLPELDGAEYGHRAEREAAARALHRLAEAAGRNGALASSPAYDELIRQFGKSVPVGARAAWGLLAPTSDRPAPDPAAGWALADALAAAGLRAHPELDPAGRLRGLTAPTILLHGRTDRLIPCTETLRLASILPPRAHCDVTLTGVFGHAKPGESLPLNPIALAGEVRRFARAVDRLLRSLER
jgi:pimeloyl-ACP methyl ester carboxylesterase